MAQQKTLKFLFRSPEKHWKYNIDQKYFQNIILELLQ